MALRRKSWIIVLVSVVVLAVLLHRLFLWYRQGPETPRGGAVCGEACGVERWAVKTLADPDASQIDFSPRSVTVGWLAQQPMGGVLPQDGRLAPVELETFTVRARLVGFKEEQDHDFHLILADLSNPSATLIAEIPSANCSGACASIHAADFERARQTLEFTFGPPENRFRYLREEPIVEVTGVGFFDFQHGQRGVAPNGIELHPVLRIQIE